MKNRVGIIILDRKGQSPEGKNIQNLPWSEIKIIVFNKLRGHCFYCGFKPKIIKKLTIDHFVSKYRGGSDDLSNLVPCCKRCNNLKSHKTLAKFRDDFAEAYGRDKFYFEEQI